MDMYQKRKMRAEKKKNNQEEKLTKVGINCDTGILGKPHSNPWKYWIFDIEIFTSF